MEKTREYLLVDLGALLGRENAVSVSVKGLKHDVRERAALQVVEALHGVPDFEGGGVFIGQPLQHLALDVDLLSDFSHLADFGETLLHRLLLFIGPEVVKEGAGCAWWGEEEDGAAKHEEEKPES